MGRMFVLLAWMMAGCGEAERVTAANDAACKETVELERRYERDHHDQAFRMIAASPECFAGPSANRDGYRILMRSAATATFAELMREYRGELTTSDSFVSACARFSQPYPSLGLSATDAGDAGTAICAYADAEGETSNALLSAMEGTEQITSASMRDGARRDIVTSAYALFYRGRLKRVDAYPFLGFQERYPLREFADPKEFGGMLTDWFPGEPLPRALIESEGIDDVALQGLLWKHFSTVSPAKGHEEKALSLAAAYVEAGYGSAVVYDALFSWLLSRQSLTPALAVAHEHLGEAAIIVVENARIEQLKSAGHYSVIIDERDGRRSRSYSMSKD